MKRVLICVLLVVATGCVGHPKNYSGSSIPEKVLSAKGVLMGNISREYKGQKGAFDYVGLVMETQTEKKYNFLLRGVFMKDREHFTFALPPGEYLFYRGIMRDGNREIFTQGFDKTFRVNAGEAVYMGDIHFHVRSLETSAKNVIKNTGFILGVNSLPARIDRTVEDNFEAAKNRFQTNNPDRDFRFSKQLVENQIQG